MYVISNIGLTSMFSCQLLQESCSWLNKEALSASFCVRLSLSISCVFAFCRARHAYVDKMNYTWIDLRNNNLFVIVNWTHHTVYGKWPILFFSGNKPFFIELIIQLLFISVIIIARSQLVSLYVPCSRSEFTSLDYDK